MIRWTFTPNTPAAGEVFTLTAHDSAGKNIARISVTNPADATFKKQRSDDEERAAEKIVSRALIDAWNANPITTQIAFATGVQTITLIAVHPHESLHVAASVQHASTGTLLQTSTGSQRDDFRDLPDIHFEGRIAPDYMIRFGTKR